MNTIAKTTRNTRTPKEEAHMWVPVQKNEKGEVGQSDALAIAPVKASEVKASGSIMQSLCLNIVSDRLDPEIREAIEKKGGIARLFNGTISDPDVAALKRVTSVKPEALRTAWATYVGNAKRVRCISLQALRKSLNEPAEKSATFKELVIAWAVANPDALDTLPVELFDIIIAAMPKAEA